MASPTGESAFPAIVVEQTPDRVRIYDLSSPLPVLRTFRPADIRLTVGAAWSHHSAMGDYTEAELDSVQEYLAWVRQSPPPK